MRCPLSLFSLGDCPIICSLDTTTLAYNYLLTSLKLTYLSLTLALVLPINNVLSVDGAGSYCPWSAVLSGLRAGIRTGGREYLEDKLFGDLPSKLWSTKVAVRGCLLVDRPLQVQFPEEEIEEIPHQRWVLSRLVIPLYLCMLNIHITADKLIAALYSTNIYQKKMVGDLNFLARLFACSPVWVFARVCDTKYVHVYGCL